MAATTTTTRIMALEGQIHGITELLEQLVAANAAKPVVQNPAPTRRDDWIPHYDACNFSRPVVAIFDDDNAAFDFRAAMAAEVSHPVAVRPCRIGAKGAEFRGYAVY